MKTRNIDPLVGRHFISQSGNLCEVKRLGTGAMRAEWEVHPSEHDQNEFAAWAQSIVGAFEETRSVGLERETEALNRWRKSQ